MCMCVCMRLACARPIKPKQTDQLMKELFPAEWFPIMSTVMVSRGGSNAVSILAAMSTRPVVGCVYSPRSRAIMSSLTFRGSDAFEAVVGADVLAEALGLLWLLQRWSCWRPLRKAPAPCRASICLLSPVLLTMHALAPVSRQKEK